MKLPTLLPLLCLFLATVDAARGPAARRYRQGNARRSPTLGRRWQNPPAPHPVGPFNITVKRPGRSDGKREPIAPRVLIVSLFEPEATVWFGTQTAAGPLGLGYVNVTVPGFSPLFPDVLCSPNLQVCLLVTGEAEVNAAATVTAIVNSPYFDLRKTYVFEAGIAGINPHCSTTASVLFARYAIQIDLEYEIDAREIPENFTTGWVPFGSKAPGQYPTTFYGTEVHEFNVNLRDRMIAAASTAKLNDTADAAAYRAKYSPPANAPPSVLAGDVTSSNVYFAGTLLGEAFANYTSLLTNGTGRYCTTAEEDNAVAEAVLRGTLAGRADYSRLIVMRTASDFDRQPPGRTAVQELFYDNQGAFAPAIANIGLAGIKVVDEIVGKWDATYKQGVPTSNYLGNVFNSFNESSPDIGSPTSYTPVIELSPVSGNEPT